MTRPWKICLDLDPDQGEKPDVPLVASLNHEHATTVEPSEADFFMLAFTWWHYFNTPGGVEHLLRFARLAATYAKNVIIWHSGDLEPKVPFANYIVLAPGLDQSTRTPGKFGIPRFIEDPLPHFTDGKLVIRQKHERPRIGFCGYGRMSRVKLVYSIYTNARTALRSRSSESAYLPPPLIPAILLRNQALKRLEKNPLVDTEFLIRNRYRAGVRRSDDRYHEPATIQYFENVLGTDYTVCIRGYGNWSYRFYETLACGRIPIFVNTRCILPFDFAVDWKKYCAWVEEDEIDDIGSIVCQFHAALSNATFEALQATCRTLWETYCTEQGYLSHFDDYLAHFPVESLRKA